MLYDDFCKMSTEEKVLKLLDFHDFDYVMEIAKTELLSEILFYDLVEQEMDEEEEYENELQIIFSRKEKTRRTKNGKFAHPINKQAEKISRTTYKYRRNLKKVALGSSLKVKGETRQNLWRDDKFSKKYQTLTGEKISPNKAYALYALT